MIKCLIVDDSKVVRKFIRNILENFQITPEEAEDGKDALSKCELTEFDVILLDWNMPIMDGFTFLKEFKAKYPNAITKIIFCTTENELSKIRDVLLNGANEYIMKPFDQEILRNKLIQTGIMKDE